VRQLLGTTTPDRRRVIVGSVAGATLAIALSALGAGPAGADASWSRTPASGLGGGTVSVASSSGALCQWIQPTDPTPVEPTTVPAPDPTLDPAVVVGGAAEGDVTYDGTEVSVRLHRDGVDVPLGTLPVTEGGAWSGTLTVPPADVAIPGGYDLFVRCVVDRPELDGVRSYDFDPLPFIVTEGPPPATVEVPTEIAPPLTVSNPVQVQGEQLLDPAPAAAGGAETAVATLPNTGDGTVWIALAGFGSLLVGGGALWWGARHARRHPAPADLTD
jgi:LPXTG-motif cell wall-anchored protein